MMTVVTVEFFELLGSTEMYRVSGVTSNHTDLKVYGPTNHIMKHFPLVEL